MEILKNLDFVQILSIGISGFGFLLILLAFLLISKEQARAGEPRAGILSTIRYFMGINLVSVIVVGIISLPSISKNGSLKQELALTTKELQITQTVNAFDKFIDTVSSANLNQNQTRQVETYVNVLDSIARSYTTDEAPKADSIQTVRNVIAEQLATIKSDTSSLQTRRMAIEKINKANHHLTDFVKSKPTLIKPD
ncbi:MAG: hypothetical protein KF856_03935 [Cyclobacteriaceae bacterium]|nr:hypothetical protein [Cyclobacteriaceae bacterium]